MNPDFGVIFIHFILLFLQSFYCIHFSTHLMHPIHPAKLLSLIIWRKATVQYLYARFASTKEIEKQKAMGNSAVQQYPLKQKAAVTLPESMIAPKYRLSQRKLVCQPSSFRCYVSFRECKGSNKKKTWHFCWHPKTKQTAPRYFVIHFFLTKLDLKWINRINLSCYDQSWVVLSCLYNYRSRPAQPTRLK